MSGLQTREISVSIDGQERVVALSAIHPPQESLDLTTGQKVIVVAGYYTDAYELVPFGKVITPPVEITVKDETGDFGGDKTGLGNRVVGAVTTALFTRDVPPGRYSPDFGFRTYSPAKIAKMTTHLEKEASKAVLTMLGLRPPKQKRLSFSLSRNKK